MERRFRKTRPGECSISDERNSEITSEGCLVEFGPSVCLKVLFEFARYLAPSIIFLDEVDALVNRRGSRMEHEATRRMQAELLVQLDLLIAASENDEEACNAQGDTNSSSVTVIAATNMPW